MSVVAIRCDGGPEVGVGHVARCRPVALALRGHGVDVRMVGAFEGLSRTLVEATQLGVEPAVAGCDAGLAPGRFAAAMVDLYRVPDGEMCRAAAGLPIATPGEAARCPDAGLHVDYHFDRPSGERPDALLGPRWAPVWPAFAGVRRERGREVGSVLVTLGGSVALRSAEPEVAGAVAQAFPDAELLRPDGSSDLASLAQRADLAVTAAGFTTYELACAGVPTLALVMVDNQERVGAGLDELGAGLTLDARQGLDPGALRTQLARLADPALRASLSAAAMTAVDGRGAARLAERLISLWGLDR